MASFVGKAFAPLSFLTAGIYFLFKTILAKRGEYVKKKLEIMGLFLLNSGNFGCKRHSMKHKILNPKHETNPNYLNSNDQNNCF